MQCLKTYFSCHSYIHFYIPLKHQQVVGNNRGIRYSSRKGSGPRMRPCSGRAGMRDITVTVDKTGVDEQWRALIRKISTSAGACQLSWPAVNRANCRQRPRAAPRRVNCQLPTPATALGTEQAT